MTFKPGNRYLLTEVVSRMQNPLHEQMVGRICELWKFPENEFGWFHIEMEDGTHTVSTSIVNRVTVTEPDRDVIVETTNSTYRFALVSEYVRVGAAEDEETEDA